jgi:ornithine carbamoyltransferase
MPRHFLTGAELTAAELHALLERAIELKRAPLSSSALEGRSIALIFQKPSTRTRLSFEVDAMLEELARDSAVPVVNMLTARHHPCQALADLLTVREAYGALDGLRIAYVGDGNNVARSLALLGTLAGMHVAVASPDGYSLEAQEPLPAGASGSLTLYTDPYEAVDGACAVYTDVWVSMGDEQTAQQRRAALAGYRVDDALLDAAAPGAFAMHDLPAHPGEEISAEVLYGSRQRIWDQAENRRHAQKALLELLV